MSGLVSLQAFVPAEPEPEPETETIYCVSGRSVFSLGTVGATQPSTNTPAGTHDGSDLTLDAGKSLQDPGSGLSYGVQYTVSTPVTNPIASVTLRMRAKMTNPPSICELFPIYDSGVVGDSQSPGSSFAWHEFVLTQNPLTELPWETSDVSAAKWGFLFSTTEASAADVTGSVSEIELVITGA